jgi:hypothetical protein
MEAVLVTSKEVGLQVCAEKKNCLCSCLRMQDKIGSGQGQMAGSCEHGNELTGYLRFGKFSD